MTACTKKVEDPLISNITFGSQSLQFNRLAWNNLGSYTANLKKHKFVLLDSRFNFTNGQFTGQGNLLELTLLTPTESMPEGVYHFSETETSPTLFNGYIALNYSATQQTAQTMSVLKGGWIDATTDNAQGSTWIKLEIRILTHTNDSLSGIFYGPLITQEVPKIN
jgi:hypothetical protein